MATKFLEPGGDATFNVAAPTAGGLWAIIGGTAPTIATDFVHGGHIKSIKPALTAVASYVVTPNAVESDAGGRISLYIFGTEQATDGLTVTYVGITTGGVLRLFQGTSNVQIGGNGPTLSTGQWYRISLAYTITSTTVNRFELFVDGVSKISVTNATITNLTSSCVVIGKLIIQGTTDSRFSDIYVDNSSALTDPGNIWVTAKRPFANGTTNGFTTQIGAGGSGYGTGHSPQVNERALSNTNGWSMVGAGSAITEEYNIEGKSVGDIDVSAATIVDWMGWADMKSAVGETVQIILDGANNAQAITSTETLYIKIKGSATYPSGTGADIGVTTDTSLTTVSLYESGIIVAFIPPQPSLGVGSALNLPLLGVG